MLNQDYTFTELLNRTDSWQFVVPEIQRDYVWDAKNWQPLLAQLAQAYTRTESPLAIELHGEEISDHLRVQVQQLYQRERYGYNLGFIYAYHDEAYPGQCFLIDGQQRLTTLYLLLLAAAMQAGETDDFKRRFCAEDYSPRLSYRVREAAHGFLERFTDFILRGGDATTLQTNRPYWYFQEYEQDVTIRNLQRNYAGMVHELPVAYSSERSFYTYLRDYVRFWFFDTDNSSQGEELYLSLNASGAPLSSSDNLKARLLSDLPAARKNHWGEQFEQWENYYWLHRKPGADTDAGLGFTEFFRWAAILHSARQPAAGKEKSLAEQLLSKGGVELVEQVIFGAWHPDFIAAQAAEERLAYLARCQYAVETVFNWWESAATTQWVEQEWGLGQVEAKVDMAWLQGERLPATVCLQLLSVLAFVMGRTEAGYPLRPLMDMAEARMLYRLLRYCYNVRSRPAIINNAVGPCVDAIQMGFELGRGGAGVEVVQTGGYSRSIVPLEEMWKLREFSRQPDEASRQQLEGLSWQLEDKQYNEREIGHLFPGEWPALRSEAVQQAVAKYELLFERGQAVQKLLSTVLLSYGEYREVYNNTGYYINYTYSWWEKHLRSNSFQDFFQEFEPRPDSLLELYHQRQAHFFALHSAEALRQTSQLHEQLFALSAYFDTLRAADTRGVGTHIWPSGGSMGWYYEWEVADSERVFGDTRYLINAATYLGFTSMRTELLPLLQAEMGGWIPALSITDLDTQTRTRIQQAVVAI